ncbi:MAG: multicopper oxidase domain-containing protein [Anaerolineae bacterium]
MRIRKHVLLSLGSLLLAIVAAAGLALLFPTSVALARNGVSVSNLPPTSCTLNGSTRTCEFWAMTGTLALPDGAVVPVWGFADSATGPAQVPGPSIVGNAGETLEVVLHNELLTETVSLTFPGQMGLLPDLEGVAAGGTITYTFVISQPGTYLYEAGMTPNGLRQVVMGLYGALVVRPTGAADQAYDDASTAFDDEALLVLGAIDPDFNDDPYGFSMETYRPEYWLINGKAYSDTAEIDTSAGHDILLRYVNATHETQGMGLLGLRQLVIGSDGRSLYPYGVVNETIAAGQTLDTLVSVPLGTEVGTKFPLYNAALFIHNAGARVNGNSGPLTFGGMMTFVNVISGEPAEMPGPTASNVSVDPSPTTGAGGVTLTVYLDDSLTGGSNVVAAEYFTDSIGAPGTGIPIAVPSPAPQVTLTTFIPGSTLATWPSGFPLFYVRGQDADGKWGASASTVLNLDKLGPDTTSLSLSVNPTNGSRPVLLRATGIDSWLGRNDVVAGAYQIGAGASIPLLLSRTDAPVVAMTGNISISLLSTLSEGTHTINVTAQDSLGTWGTPGTIDLYIDRTGPQSALLTLTPNILDLSGAPPVTNVRMEGFITDTLASGIQSPLANAEAFIDRTGPVGTGFDIFPSDGLFDEVGEQVYFDIPISAFINLSQGQHYVYAHGLDEAGNWGGVGSAVITIDRGASDTVGPDVTSMVISPNPTNGDAWATLTGNASDPQALSNISAGEYYVNSDPGYGNAVAVQAEDGAFDSTVEALKAQLQTGLWANGTYQVYMRAQDGALNWGPDTSISLEVNGNGALILSDGFESGDLGLWSNTVGAVGVTADAAIDEGQGAMGLQTDIGGGAPAYASVVMPAGERDYETSFYFDPNGAEIGTDHHDIFSGLQLGVPIFGIQVEKADAGEGYELRAWTLSNGVPAYTAWYDISDAPHRLGLVWEAGKLSQLSFSVDGVVVEDLEFLDTSAYRVYEVRLGPSANLDPAASGIEYFDSFESSRNVRFYLPLVWKGW